KRGVNSAEILKQLQDVFKEDSMKKSTVYDWAKRYKEGRDSVDDDPRLAAPPSRKPRQMLNECACACLKTVE
ncbi:hypothetical protein U1Q18_045530, partial [Sarracenia purpurea var. burkii]